MKSPFWKTYLAVAVLVGLGSYVYFVDSKRPPAGADKPKEKALTLDRTKVTQVEITAAGQTTKLTKDGANWKLTEPIQVGADASVVDGMVSSLESVEIDEVAADAPKDLAEFGLKDPKLAVSVLLQGATEPVKLLLGDKTPDSRGVYAKLPSQSRVFTVASFVGSSFDKKPFDLRDRDVLHVKRDSVKTLAIEGPEGNYTLAKDAKGDWAIRSPLSTRAGRFAADGLVGNLESLRMEKVAAEEAKDLKPFGLDKPARKVTLGLQDGTSRTLEIGSSPEPKKFHVRDAASKLVAVVPGAIVDDLAKGLSEMRAKRLLEVATYEVEGYDAEFDAKKHSYGRTGEKDKEGIDVYKWKRTAPDAADLETNKVQDAFFLVGGLEVSEFVDKPEGLETYGLDKPILKVTLRYGAAKPPVWFEVGQKDTGWFGRREGDDAILKLDATKAADLVKAFKAL